MAEAKDDKKESQDALEELKSSIESFGEKFDNTVSEINTINSRLDEFKTNLDNVSNTTTPSFTPEEEGYVPKGWTPGTEKGWNDVFGQSAKIAEEIAEKKAQEKLESYKTEVEEAAKSKQAEDDAVNQKWDKELDQLEKENRIPKVENESDPNDPGRAARREIFNLGIEYNSPDLIKMAALRDKLRSVPPAGSWAPVGSSSGTTEPSKIVNYDEIHGKSYDDLVREDFPK